jgi:hypothetical protein
MHTFHKLVLPIRAHFLFSLDSRWADVFLEHSFPPRYLFVPVCHKSALFCALISPLQLRLQAGISATASRFMFPMKVHQNVILWGNTAHFRRLKSWNVIYTVFCTRSSVHRFGYCRLLFFLFSCFTWRICECCIEIRLGRMASARKLLRWKQTRFDLQILTPVILV